MAISNAIANYQSQTYAPGGPSTTADWSPLLYLGLSRILLWLQISSGFTKTLYTKKSMDRGTVYEREFTPNTGMSVIGEGQEIPVSNMGEATPIQTIYQAFNFGKMMSVTSIAEEDNLYKEFFPKAQQQMDNCYTQVTDELGAMILNNATGDMSVGGDGKPLISSQHPLAMGKTWSNRLTPANTGAPFNVQSLSDLIAQIVSWPANYSGQIQQGIKHTRIIGTPAQRTQFEILLRSPNMPATGDNDINPVNNSMSLGFFCNPYYKYSAATLIQTNAPDGLTHMIRREPAITMDTNFYNDNRFVKLYVRQTFGYSNARCMAGIIGAE